MEVWTRGLLITLLTGCAARAQEPVQAHEARAQLFFELRGVPFKVGIVHASVAGVPTLALIDTGAGRHVISTALAERIGQPILDSEDTTQDAAGRKLTFGIVPGARIELDGLGPLPMQSPVVLDLPPMFTELGIGLILSPQRAVETGQALRIDYKTGALTWTEDAAIESSNKWIAADRCGGSDEHSGPFFLFDATIDGEAVSLTLDTGADSTCVFGAAPIASVLRSRYETTTAQAFGAGGPILMRRTPEIRIHVGEVAAMRALPILPREAHGACGQDGHLGLDVLRSCVVVISREHASVRCPS